MVVMSYSDAEHRPSVIRGLRDLAVLLESCPGIPTPYTVEVLVFPPHGTDAEICAEVDRVAALLGVPVRDETAHHAHYTASQHFGSVEYRIVAIPSRIRAYHNAQNSYAGNVVPGVSEEADR
jgi:hypothetical protein